jgi:N-glycosylase/DNA lyase
MGIFIGLLLKYEIDIRARKKRVKNRMTYMMATANNSNIQQYNDMLESLRGINKSLLDIDKKKKEV